ncbi:5-oxoprolinase subunit PxpB [Halobacillus sp. BBL2006]|uniref:5-oxoprolinase subunit PxpB n=1 Tax=Halobacillus sp. BBL2006 TaxID=1543706 RepID=UPI0005429E96|nr:5-oxoprolinase subunit PxpB [Halobacillus sp. BBL2006]KHE67295.1 kinase inhibitor [Halobacillus sp. BBL2006]
MKAHYHPLGDRAVVIELGTKIDLTSQKRVKQVCEKLDSTHPDWMVEYIPAFTTVTVFYNPITIKKQTHSSELLPYKWVCKQLEDLISNLSVRKSKKPRVVEIPVCYGGEFGPDLSYVAEKNDLSEQKVINLHMNGDYLVYMIGFAPGFPYIGGMDKRIATSRRDDPRLKIPAGSVGIAGQQTGVYPIETPGGWQLIGRTPLQLFQPENEIPSLLQAGDKIKFTSITEEEYRSIKEDES